MMVEAIDDEPYGTVIGQVFPAEHSKPVAELYYDASGDPFISVLNSQQMAEIVFSPKLKQSLLLQLLHGSLATQTAT